MLSNRDQLERIYRTRLVAVVAAVVGMLSAQAGQADEDSADASTRKVVRPAAAVSSDVNRCERLNVGPTGMVSIPVEIFGKQTEFVLCTGIRYGVCLPHFREQLAALPRPEHEIHPASTLNVEFFPAPEIKIGQKYPELFRSTYGIAVAAKGSRLFHQYRQPGDGVLGMDYLQTKVLRINADARIAELKSFKTMDVDDSTLVEKMSFVSGVPRILLGLSTEGFDGFSIESAGQLRVLLKRDVFNKLLKKHKIAIDFPATAYNKESLGRQGILESIDLGPYRFCNVPVEEGPLNSVGAAILGRFDAEYDFSNRIAYLKPGSRMHDPAPRPRIGCRFYPLGEATMICQVVAGSPAEAAGLRVGDSLRSVDGISIADLSRPDLEAQLSVPGAVRKLMVERDQGQVDIEVTLANDPDPFPTTEQSAPTSEFDFDK